MRLAGGIADLCYLIYSHEPLDKNDPGLLVSLQVNPFYSMHVIKSSTTRQMIPTIGFVTARYMLFIANDFGSIEIKSTQVYGGANINFDVSASGFDARRAQSSPSLGIF